MAKPKSTKDLQKYSKDDLIWIINRMSSFGQGWYLNEALWSEIPIATLEKAEKAMKKAQSYDKQYCKLMGI